MQNIVSMHFEIMYRYNIEKSVGESGLAEFVMVE